MKERTFVIFIQIGDVPDRKDQVKGYIHGTAADAQKECNSLNAAFPMYHYFMNLEDLKQHENFTV